MKRLIGLLLALTLLMGCLPAFALEKGLPLQRVHQVTLTWQDTVYDNKSRVRLWQAETALPEVTGEINQIARGYAETYGQDLPAARNAANGNSRLDVEIRYSRTGLSWLSFLVQARVIYHRDLTAQYITSRTYDMETGQRIALTDIFAEESEGWALLEAAVRSQCAAYWPDEEPDAAALEGLCSRESLRETDFTLHGMSLVLHIPAQLLYPEHLTLMEVTLMYPAIRPYMTEKAQTETDNLSYYNTCALTFDDGPSRDNTLHVLNSLMITGSRATFFVVGNRIDSYEDQVQREHDQGHAVAPHNWTHANISKVSGTRLQAMKPRCDAALIKAIGVTSAYDRVPYGLYPRMIKAKVGWAYIQWSLDTYDWRGLKSTKVLQRVQKQISDGDIILCHDIKDNTGASAQMIASWLAENGYMLLTVDELFAKDGVALTPDKVYYRCVNGDTSKK